jgi:hypothetical protein
MVLRILLLTGWVLAGVGGVVYHLSAGPEQTALDDAARHVKAAEAAAAAGDYESAAAGYESALKALPTGRVTEGRKIRLERAKAQMLARQLPEAHADLKALVDELTADPAADPTLLAGARSSLANSQYYVTWLMRLEGLSQDEWGPEVEASRQGYRLLAEQAEARGDAAAAKKYREDLEASVRLARMELSELQGLPLPSQ